MVRVLIIEDELAASKRLHKLLQELLPDAKIEDTIGSVITAVNWLYAYPMPDLIFADVQLADGSSFEIFKQIQITCPIIFITAFDQYAIEAFKHNSIHYLLKPLKKDELTEALDKFKRIQGGQAKTPPIDFEKMLHEMRQPQKKYKERFIIRFGEHIKTIEIKDVAYFYTENKANYAVLTDARRYPIDHNLDELDQMVNPKNFFRINRQFIIGYNSIAEMVSYSKSRVLIKLNPPSKLETIVSTERSAAFKSWLAGE